MEIFFALVIFYFLAMPLLTLLHELGHAAFPVFWEKATVSIRVGPMLDGENATPMIHWRSTKLDIQITSLLKPWQGYCSWSFVRSYREQVIALALGPATSLILGLLFSALLLLFGAMFIDGARHLLTLCALFCFLQFSITAIPMRYPNFSAIASNKVSDGRQIASLLSQYYFARSPHASNERAPATKN